MIEFHCHKCRERIDVPEAHAGRMISCPRCQSSVEVPQVEFEQEVEASSLDLENDLPQRDWDRVAEMLDGLDQGTELQMARLEPLVPTGMEGPDRPHPTAVHTTVTSSSRQKFMTRLKKLISPDR